MLYIISQKPKEKKNELLLNETLKIGCKGKWKFLVKICPNSLLATFVLLDFLLA